MKNIETLVNQEMVTYEENVNALPEVHTDAEKETLSFFDAPAEERIVQGENRNIKKKIALVCAVASTVLTLLSLTGAPLYLISIPLALVSYIIKPSGILGAIRSANKLGRFFWLIIPVFPFDVLLGLAGMICGSALFLLMPAFYVLKD